MFVDDTPTTDSTDSPAGDAASSYDGGRDISAVLDAASKAADKPTDAPTDAPKATDAPTTQADAQKAAARAWKLFKDNQELKDFDPTKMTAADFLALKIGYNANGKEQQRDFDGLVRNAQQGHYNESKTARLEQERQQAVENWRKYESQYTQLESQRKVWIQAVTAATRGHFDPIINIIKEFQQALDSESQPAPQVPEGYVKADEVERQRQGERVYQEVVLPEARNLAKQFGFTEEQCATAIMAMVERYPSEFMDRQVLDNIMKVELPNYLTQLREQHPLPAPEVSAEMKKIAELEAKLAALSGQKAEQHNSAVTAVHARREAAPPGVPTTGAGAGALETPDFESASAARKWLREQR